MPELTRYKFIAFPAANLFVSLVYPPLLLSQWTLGIHRFGLKT